MTSAREEFVRWYGKTKKKPEIFESFCPYRVCPLGAHVDHQYGYVSGFAIDKGIKIVYAPTAGVVRVRSLNFEGEKTFHVDRIPPRQNDWADYLRGAAWALDHRVELKRGLNCVIEGSLPIGGLSSSAAVIIAFLSALCKANNVRLSRADLIAVALEAETKYVGVNVGKLDQSCEVYSQKDKLLFLDTKTDRYELIPRSPKTPPFEIAIFFSGVERRLAGTRFNVRVDELKASAYALKGWAEMDCGLFSEARLRDVPFAVFEKYASRLPENWRKRATHYYSEVARVKQGAELWRAGNLKKFGQLVFESGYSSIHNYETGSEELRTLYELMLEVDGVYGGRFSGAGFKGCCMALVDPAKRETVAAKMTAGYLREFPNLEGKFSIHFCQTSNGVDYF
ncbi:MAG: hypothetical protein IJM30_12615 [Thermoguttaceae bacterium]|nr:hypothetical protein [Thermoguttaceae bacterium]